jgi:hypothetical protein
MQRIQEDTEWQQFTKHTDEEYVYQPNFIKFFAYFSVVLMLLKMEYVMRLLLIEGDKNVKSFGLSILKCNSCS